ncbi:MAG: response regulator [Ignavibacteria bacterium]
MQNIVQSSMSDTLNNLKEKSNILWVDDEIESLKSNIMFLKQKGYNVQEATNGEDGINLIRSNEFDLVFLDEMMTGMGGLQTLLEIKDIKPSLPVVMVTKNETESLMEDAIGNKISDYLIKPVNPTQLLLVCKKMLDSKRLKGSQVSKDYIQEFNKISMAMMESPTWQEWIDIHMKNDRMGIGAFDEHPDLGLKQQFLHRKEIVLLSFQKLLKKLS